MKKILILVFAFVAVFALSVKPAFAAAPYWNVSGDWVFDYNDGNVNLHDMTLVQDGTGSLTGSGGAFAGDPTYQYPWVITSGLVDGETITFTADYTATVNCSFTATGTIAINGTMSGDWMDNCAGNRNGTWTTQLGEAMMFPRVITNDATNVLTTSATINGTNGPVDADGTSFWMGPALPDVPFYPADTATTVTQLQDWYSVYGNYDPKDANAQFSYSKTDLVPGTTYYFVAWSFVGGIWYPGEILSFRTTDLVLPLTNKDQCKNGGWMTFANPPFKNQGDCVSFVQSSLNAVGNKTK
ncbi:MAG: hypothetical protein WC243_02495 [Patescibacteria group bacterium]|jgi:hypothetical protein